MRFLFTVLVLVSSLSANAWEVRNHYKDDSKYILLMRDADLSDLENVVGKENRILSGINLGRVIQIRSDSLQVEIQDYLKKHHPKILEAAYSSAGNMHNPKVKPLRKPFEEAVVNSSYVQSIADILRKHGYDVAGVSTEKFMLINQKSLDAMAWLKVKQLTKSSKATPKSGAL